MRKFWLRCLCLLEFSITTPLFMAIQGSHLHLVACLVKFMGFRECLPARLAYPIAPEGRHWPSHRQYTPGQQLPAATW